MTKIKYKGKNVTADKLSKAQLGDYIMSSKSSHDGFRTAVRAYMKKRK